MGTIIISIVLSVIGYFLLMIIGTNLIGMVVRGFFRNTNLEKMKGNKEVHEIIKDEIRKNDRAGIVVTIFSMLFCIIFLYLLYRYINAWAVLAALFLMIGRIPDLLWEIQSGQRITKTNMPKGAIYIVASGINWLALPVLWWGLYTLLV